jgi:hypothetical protein
MTTCFSQNSDPDKGARLQPFHRQETFGLGRFATIVLNAIAKAHGILIQIEGTSAID